MASLFAFCANNKADFSVPPKAGFGGGILPEVSLVTFGAASPAKTPLYNGEEGKCFKGTRRYTFVEPSPTSQQFHVANLRIFAELASYVAPSGAAALNQTYLALQAMTDYPSATSTALIAQANAGIGAMWLAAYAIMLNVPVPGMESLLPLYPHFATQFGGMLQTSVPDLLYSYDPVPQLFSGFGYKHPLVKAEPQPHTLVGNDPMPSTPCADGAAVPNDADCIDQFTGTGYGVKCTPSMFR